MNKNKPAYLKKGFLIFTFLLLALATNYIFLTIIYKKPIQISALSILAILYLIVICWEVYISKKSMLLFLVLTHLVYIVVAFIWTVRYINEEEGTVNVTQNILHSFYIFSPNYDGSEDDMVIFFFAPVLFILVCLVFHLVYFLRSNSKKVMLTVSALFVMLFTCVFWGFYIPSLRESAEILTQKKTDFEKINMNACNAKNTISAISTDVNEFSSEDYISSETLNNNLMAIDSCALKIPYNSLRNITNYNLREISELFENNVQLLNKLEEIKAEQHSIDELSYPLWPKHLHKHDGH